MNLLVLPRNFGMNNDQLEITASLCYGSIQEVTISLPLAAGDDTRAVFLQAIKDSAKDFIEANWEVTMQPGEEVVVLGMPA